ncbi:hypothetical protein C8A00DRAFT_35805 [Chaetomidium leptoderma]|uniref:RNA helicase n=1 Tax=Chaetomidium leptoderma TaxID=669021 RepID=A0AAN6ZVF2_9PEZI|nr:hypothetical protein C8A00DRAFT_35805 [Chaetomidium leptoderma]
MAQTANASDGAAFVSEHARRINQEPGIVIYDTSPTNGINFVAYTNHELMQSLLPAAVALDPTYSYQAASREGIQLRSGNYERFFRFHLDGEIGAQQRANDSYSLYQHEGVVEFAQGPWGGQQNQAVVAVVVPGLREDTPLVEREDVVQLRQLRYNSTSGHLLLHHPDLSGRLNPVLSEVLLHPSSFHARPQRHQLRFNVQFPVATHRYQPMYYVLPMIQAALRRANEMTIPAQRMAELETGNWVSTYWTQSMLFPTEADCDVQTNIDADIAIQARFDPALNHEQCVAVANVCSQNYGILPCLISGPQGTGKTKTLAADTLADRLRPFFSPGEMLRLNRPARGFAEVPESLLPYCYASNLSFGLPPMEKVMSYKIVVTSCRDASMLMHARLTNTDLHALEYGLRHRLHPSEPTPYPNQQLHWDALLIDEAAQATEPESLIPLWVVSPPLDSSNLVFTPLVVMAGGD